MTGFRVFITGIAGTLGCSLARLFLEKGAIVSGNDIARIDEAWKLDGIKDKIDYLWKSTMDLDPLDIEDQDLIFDCGLEFGDRPLGISSPTHTLVGNLMPPLRMLETLRKIKNTKTVSEKIPTVIYASSFNTLYGWTPGTCYTEDLPPNPSSQYGWSKAAAEMLYTTYQKAYNLPIIVSRVGSAFGPRMRTDELVAKLIIYALQNKDFYLRSPHAVRMWTYAKDVMACYDILSGSYKDHVGKTLICAGNKGDNIVTNYKLATMIKKLTGSSMTIIAGEYEPGEMINGKPVSFTVDSHKTRSALGWEPNYMLEDGLLETIEWFKENVVKN